MPAADRTLAASAPVACDGGRAPISSAAAPPELPAKLPASPDLCNPGEISRPGRSLGPRIVSVTRRRTRRATAPARADHAVDPKRPLPSCYALGVNVGDIETLLQSSLPRLVPGLAAAYLFGSFARGEARPDSDVDVGLLYSKPPPSTLEGQPYLAGAELESLLGRRVDLVVLNAAPVDLVHRVLRDGILLLEPDRSARIAFEVRARNQYFDLLPILQLYRRGGRAA